MFGESGASGGVFGCLGQGAEQPALAFIGAAISEADPPGFQPWFGIAGIFDDAMEGFFQGFPVGFDPFLFDLIDTRFVFHTLFQKRLGKEKIRLAVVGIIGDGLAEPFLGVCGRSHLQGDLAAFDQGHAFVRPLRQNLVQQLPGCFHVS